MRSRLIICLVVVFCGAQTFAQGVLTPEQAVELALKNNYDILLAKNEAEIAARNNTVGNAGMLPRVDAYVTDNYVLNNLNQKLTTGTEIKKNNASGNTVGASVALNWTLFDGLRMFATKGRLNKLEEIGELQYKDQLQTAVADVLNSYYGIVGAKQQLVAIQEAISISEERVKLADMKFQVGTAGKTDLLQAKVDLNAQKSNAINQRKVITQRKAALNALLARAAETDFDVLDTIPVNPDLGLSADLDNKNFQLQAAMKNVDVAKYQKKEAFSFLLPDLTGTVGYGYSRAQNSAGFSLFNQAYGLNAGFTLHIPLFNGLNTLREVKIASINILNSQFNLERARFQVKLSYYSALRDYQDAKELLALEQENIQLADENQKIALERFRLGQSTSIELREAQISYVDARTRLVNARYGAKVAENELLRLQGELVK
ncbi:MAG: TolC family protein [Chitinophagales bacterium]